MKALVYERPAIQSLLVAARSLFDHLAQKRLLAVPWEPWPQGHAGEWSGTYTESQEWFSCSPFNNVYSTQLLV